MQNDLQPDKIALAAFRHDKPEQQIIPEGGPEAQVSLTKYQPL